MEVFATLIKDILIEELEDHFKGIFGKIRLKYLSKKLEEDVYSEILRKYGEKKYYLKFDHFLMEQNVINNVIKNFISQDTLQEKTINQLVDYYLNFFIEKYPEYKLYRNDLKQIVKKYFEIIFKRLNKLVSPEAQKICRVVKELANELSEQIQDLNDITNDNNEILRKLVNGNFKDRLYTKTLLALVRNQVNQGEQYIERRLFQYGGENGTHDSLKALLKEHKVVLTGEAGFGKTFETLKIINQLCVDYSKYKLIPIYFPLTEYEISTGSLYSIIHQKLAPFCEGNTIDAVTSLFATGMLAIFFDGIDDISDDKQRIKFFNEANQLTTQYNNNFFFFTTRTNRYKGELGGDRNYNLTAISNDIIQKELIRLGRFSKVPQTYLELFKNPLLYKISVNILSQTQNKDLFNRTKIFEEYFEGSYRSYKNSNTEFTLHNTLNILGKFSYENFEKQSFEYHEIDKILSQYSNSTPTGKNIIDYFINFGIFNVSDKISFSHKLFKEFCAAYYLINEFSVTKDISLFKEIIFKDEWKEVIIFCSGLFSSILEQDGFLDFVLSQNFPLYIECVNSKNDLLDISKITKKDSSDYVNRILSIIHKTYVYIVNNYFNPINNQFEPFFQEELRQLYKVSITGSIAGNVLNYWFDIVNKDEKNIKVISPGNIAEAKREYQKKIFMKVDRTVQRSINLEMSGLDGDSGRKIAIDIVKQNLKSILKEKRIWESKYILSESLKESKNKLPWLREVNSICSMTMEVNRQIDSITKDHPMVSHIITAERVDLIGLKDLLVKLKNMNICYNKSVIPGVDRDYSVSNGKTLNLYSKNRKIEIITSFFNFAEDSYLEMVKYNFPVIYEYFSKVQNMPYKFIVEYEDDEQSPSITYYYLADKSSSFEVAEVDKRKTFEQINKKVMLSYYSFGKVPKKFGVRSSTFMVLLFSSNARQNPLSDFVYNDIRSSLEEIFGRF